MPCQAPKGSCFDSRSGPITQVLGSIPNQEATDQLSSFTLIFFFLSLPSPLSEKLIYKLFLKKHFNIFEAIHVNTRRSSSFILQYRLPPMSKLEFILSFLCFHFFFPITNCASIKIFVLVFSSNCAEALSAAWLGLGYAHLPNYLLGVALWSQSISQQQCLKVLISPTSHHHLVFSDLLFFKMIFFPCFPVHLFCPQFFY